MKAWNEQGRIVPLYESQQSNVLPNLPESNTQEEQGDSSEHFKEEVSAYFRKIPDHTGIGGEVVEVEGQNSKLHFV